MGAAVAASALWTAAIEEQAHVAPGYSREDLRPLLAEGAVRGAVQRLKAEGGGGDGDGGPGPRYLFTEAEYERLYRQTGLGKGAVDCVLRRQHGAEELLDMQETFFTVPDYICIKDNWISHREQTTDGKGNIVRATELTGLEDGDIILTKSSHVLGWRNGHAALVVDAENRKTLEAIVIGENTGIRRFTKWEKYPNVLVLRLAGVSAEIRAKAAQWAVENMTDIPYRLTAGFFGTKDEVWDSLAAPEDSASEEAWRQGGEKERGAEREKGEKEEGEKGRAAAAVTGTQCAHLIWRAYAQFGYDLDPDGGWLVTPRQLAKSPLLEVVQVYGMDPESPWP